MKLRYAENPARDGCLRCSHSVRAQVPDCCSEARFVCNRNALTLFNVPLRAHDDIFI